MGRYPLQAVMITGKKKKRQAFRYTERKACFVDGVDRQLPPFVRQQRFNALSDGGGAVY